MLKELQKKYPKLIYALIGVAVILIIINDIFRLWFKIVLKLAEHNRMSIWTSYLNRNSLRLFRISFFHI